MKTQLLQDIGESRGIPRMPPFADAKRADPDRTVEPNPPPPTFGPTDWNAFGYSGLAMDGLDEYSSKPRHWLVRWGRKLATSGLVLTVLVLLAAAGIWFYHDAKEETTMVVLAQQPLPARDTPAAPVIQVPAAVMPAPPAVVQAPPAIVQTPPPVIQAPPVVVQAPPVVVQASPAAKETSTPASPAAEAPPSRVEPKRQRKPPLKAIASSAEPAPSRTRQMDETLRQCRAAGYHAAKCIERGCVMTRYGLACKG